MRKTALARLATLALGVAISACGGGSSSSGPAPAPGVDPSDPANPSDPGCDQSFDSTFAAIQTVIFERHGCTQNACHGSARQGGLDLRPDAAYANLIETPSLGSSLERIVPGSPDRSYFFHKLAANTRPGGSRSPGRRLPAGSPALTRTRPQRART